MFEMLRGRALNCPFQRCCKFFALMLKKKSCISLDISIHRNSCQTLHKSQKLDEQRIKVHSIFSLSSRHGHQIKSK